MKKQRLSTERPSIQLDMSAMAGLAFLLLTFFLVVHNVSRPKVRQLDMPAPYRSADEQTELWAPGIITLIIDQKEKVHYYFGLADKCTLPTVYTTTLHAADLENVLRNQKKGAVLIQIKNTPTATYQGLVSVLDEMRKTNQQHYALADMTAEEYALLAKNQL